VKIRGYRIELGEIESRLAKHEAVREAVVVAQTDENGGASAKCLCAYLVSSREMTVSELREFLGQSLPEYMIPQVFVQLDQLPRTPNGKIDRKALPKASQERAQLGVEYTAPQTVIENQLTAIWQEMLKCDRVGIHDNFFDLGGNSLLLVLMSSRVNGLYPGKVEVTDIFAHPTIAKLAQFIETGKETGIIKPEELAFPLEYFTEPGEVLGSAGDDQGELLFKFQIDEPQLDKLAKIAGRLEIELPELLLGAYLYLLAEVSEQQVIVVQTMITGSDTVFPLRIDLNEIVEMPGLERGILAIVSKAEQFLGVLL
jgi:hypothetical protein